jgi:hypothetical protein
VAVLGALPNVDGGPENKTEHTFTVVFLTETPETCGLDPALMHSRAAQNELVVVGAIVFP